MAMSASRLMLLTEKAIFRLSIKCLLMLWNDFVYAECASRRRGPCDLREDRVSILHCDSIPSDVLDEWITAC
jgi:hypothetical protein